MPCLPRDKTTDERRRPTWEASERVRILKEPVPRAEYVRQGSGRGPVVKYAGHGDHVHQTSWKDSKSKFMARKECTRNTRKHEEGAEGSGIGTIVSAPHRGPKTVG